VTQKSPAEISADMLDVHVLDIMGHIEALLRSAREVQRGILRARGIPHFVTPGEHGGAVADVQQRLARMLGECDAAKQAVEAAALSARHLQSREQG
jgi:hypothetical protein